MLNLKYFEKVGHVGKDPDVGKDGRGKKIERDGRGGDNRIKKN